MLKKLVFSLIKLLNISIKESKTLTFKITDNISYLWNLKKLVYFSKSLRNQLKKLVFFSTSFWNINLLFGRKIKDLKFKKYR